MWMRKFNSNYTDVCIRMMHIKASTRFNLWYILDV